MGLSTEDQSSCMWELMKPSWYPNLSMGLIWDLTADLELEESDAESVHGLALIHYLLALKVKKRSEKTHTEGNFPSESMRTGECLANSWGLEGHVCGTVHCLETLAEQHRQLARLFGRLTM